MSGPAIVFALIVAGLFGCACYGLGWVNGFCRSRKIDDKYDRAMDAIREKHSTAIDAIMRRGAPPRVLPREWKS